MVRQWIMGLLALSWVLGAGVAKAEVPPSGTIAPHKAVYRMSLARVKGSSSIRNVAGTMTFEWADACDGWAIQQKMDMTFIHAENDDSEVKSNVVTWEAKDGSGYRFNIRRTTNGEEDEAVKGKATMGKDGGKALFEKPQEKGEKNLPADAMFPSFHTQQILERAAKGEKMFTRYVFDGSDEEGGADISAFIGPRQDTFDKSSLPTDLRAISALHVAAWPVRLAFYKQGDETGVPDYEMQILLQSNGIARSLQIDYGDFVVNASLTGLEILPVPSCGGVP